MNDSQRLSASCMSVIMIAFLLPILLAALAPLIGMAHEPMNPVGYAWAVASGTLGGTGGILVAHFLHRLFNLTISWRLALLSCFLTSIMLFVILFFLNIRMKPDGMAMNNVFVLTISSGALYVYQHTFLDP